MTEQQSSCWKIHLDLNTKCHVIFQHPHGLTKSISKCLRYSKCLNVELFYWEDLLYSLELVAVIQKWFEPDPLGLFLAVGSWSKQVELISRVAFTVLGATLLLKCIDEWCSKEKQLTKVNIIKTAPFTPIAHHCKNHVREMLKPPDLTHSFCGL